MNLISAATEEKIALTLTTDSCCTTIDIIDYVFGLWITICLRIITSHLRYSGPNHRIVFESQDGIISIIF